VNQPPELVRLCDVVVDPVVLLEGDEHDVLGGVVAVPAELAVMAVEEDHCGLAPIVLGVWRKSSAMVTPAARE
jgi:hypothetical protein